MENGSKSTQTLGDLTPSELIDRALQEVSKVIKEHEQDTPGPACGAYAYLSLAKSKLDGGE
jgi:hypothetical protein